MLYKARFSWLACVLLITLVRSVDATALGCVTLSDSTQLNLDTEQVQAVQSWGAYANYMIVTSPDDQLQAYIQADSADNTDTTHFSVQLIDQLNHVAMIRSVNLSQNDIQFAWSASGATLFYLWKTPEGGYTLARLIVPDMNLAPRCWRHKPTML